MMALAGLMVQPAHAGRFSVIGAGADAGTSTAIRTSTRVAESARPSVVLDQTASSWNKPPAWAPAKYVPPSEAAGGKTTTWVTKNHRVTPSAEYPSGTKPRPVPQQNSKTVSGPNSGEHRFYDASHRPPKEGAALANAPRKNK
jgi:hypothetical protein